MGRGSANARAAVLSDEAPWLALAALAFLTSTVSAILGLAGGVLLLAALLVVFEPLVAIPLHGVVQLASNGSRAYLQRRHVQYELLAPFFALLIPAGLLGLWVVQRLPGDAMRLAIGAFVLVATWLPTAIRLPSAGSVDEARRRFFLAGGLVGVANILVGATGPIIAPFVLSLPLRRNAVVGTLAFCQGLGHLVKIALFAGFGFAFTGYAVPLVGLVAGAFAGSWWGTRLLERVDERVFRLAIRWVLTLLAAHLIWRALS